PSQEIRRVKRFLFGCGLWLLFGVVPLAAQRRSAPDWLGKPIDQGAHDRRLDGYVAPEGVKVEVVAIEPAIAHPMGLAFGRDGGLYVLESVPGAQGPPRQRVRSFRASKGTSGFREVAPALDVTAAAGVLWHDGYLY